MFQTLLHRRPPPGSSKEKGRKFVLPEIELFKQRHASVFGEVEVKVEEPDAGNSSARAPSAVDFVEEETICDSVLMREFGLESRRLAVDQLVQAARRNPTSGTDFGVTYVEATVSRLRRKGIDEPRLVEVISMLQEGLWQPLLQFCVRVERLGGLLPSPLSSPPKAGQVAASTITATNSSVVNDSLNLLTSQPSSASVPLNGTEKPPSYASDLAPSETSDSSSDDNDDDEATNAGSQRTSKYRDDDDEEYVESCSRTARVEHQDGTTPVRLTGFSQPFANYINLQLTSPAQPTIFDCTEQTEVTENCSTRTFALSSLHSCFRLVTTLLG